MDRDRYEIDMLQSDEYFAWCLRESKHTRTRPNNTYRLVACGRDPAHCDEWNCCQKETLKEPPQCKSHGSY